MHPLSKEMHLYPTAIALLLCRKHDRRALYCKVIEEFQIDRLRHTTLHIVEVIDYAIVIGIVEVEILGTDKEFIFAVSIAYSTGLLMRIA